MNSQRPIILVEDDRAIREGLTEFLECEGFAVRTGDNGQKGLELIRATKGTCLVLLDLQMPVMSGQQLLDALLNENEEIRRTPVLVLTASGEKIEHQGIVGTLRKPIDLDELLEKIHVYCSGV